jgi:hypothetical protein
LDETYDDCAERAVAATRQRIDDDGGLWGVSACTYAGGSSTDDVQMYRTLPSR